MKRKKFAWYLHMMATIANFAVKRGCHSAIPLIAVPRKIPALGAAIVPTHPNWLSGDLDDQQGAQCLRDPATASRVAEQVQIPDLQPSQIAISGGRLDGQDCLPSLLQFFDVDADNDEVEIVPNFAFDFERLEPCSPSVLHRGIRPPTPRSEATVCVVTWGNIAEPAATAFVALLIALLSVRTIGYSGEQCSGGEGVSQSPLKDKAFLIFLGQDPPFELRPKTGVSPPILSWNPSWLIQVLAQHFNFRRRRTAGLVGVCPPKAKVTRSNRVGCASFFLFYSAICALGLKLEICLVRVSKQNPKKIRHRMQIARLLTTSVATSSG